MAMSDREKHKKFCTPRVGSIWKEGARKLGRVQVPMYRNVGTLSYIL